MTTEQVVPPSTVGAAARPAQGIGRTEWLRYGPFLAQTVIVRRCNLSCSYCSEFDRTSEPVPFTALLGRFRKLKALRTWAVCLTGGEEVPVSRRYAAAVRAATEAR